MTIVDLVGPAATHVVATEIDGCVALFNPETAEAIFLNETASDIWRLSDGTCSLPEMTDRLAEAYGTDPATISADVSQTVSILRDRGFLTQAQRSPR